MTDLINRQAAIDAINALHEKPNAWLDSAVDAVMTLPSAYPKKGRWIKDGHHIQCDSCGMWMCDTDREGDAIPKEFCPNCGADMRESG